MSFRRRFLPDEVWLVEVTTLGMARSAEMVALQLAEAEWVVPDLTEPEWAEPEWATREVELRVTVTCVGEGLGDSCNLYKEGH